MCVYVCYQRGWESRNASMSGVQTSLCSGVRRQRETRPAVRPGLAAQNDLPSVLSAASGSWQGFSQS
eukprot:gene14901-biopygen11178